MIFKGLGFMIFVYLAPWFVNSKVFCVDKRGRIEDLKPRCAQLAYGVGGAGRGGGSPMGRSKIQRGAKRVFRKKGKNRFFESEIKSEKFFPTEHNQVEEKNKKSGGKAQGETWEKDEIQNPGWVPPPRCKPLIVPRKGMASGRGYGGPPHYSLSPS